MVSGGNVSSNFYCIFHSKVHFHNSIPLCIFAKEPTALELNGITNDNLDFSVDIIKNVTLPLLKHFGIHNMELKIKRRGASPNGGGTIEFISTIVRDLKPINLIDMGLVKRVRGLAFSSRVSPSLSTRVIDSARSVLNHLLPDVYIHTDHYQGSDFC